PVGEVGASRQARVVEPVAYAEIAQEPLHGSLRGRAPLPDGTHHLGPLGLRHDVAMTIHANIMPEAAVTGLRRRAGSAGAGLDLTPPGRLTRSSRDTTPARDGRAP